MHKLLFSQFIHFSSVLLTKNVKSFYIFHRGSEEVFDEKCIIYYFLHFSFSVATKYVKILLKVRGVLNLEIVHMYFLSVGEVIV